MQTVTELEDPSLQLLDLQIRKHLYPRKYRLNHRHQTALGTNLHANTDHALHRRNILPTAP